MTASNRIRAALSNPRVLALGAVGTVAAVFLIRHHGASSSASTTDTTPLPVEPSADPFAGTDLSSSGDNVPAGVTDPPDWYNTPPDWYTAPPPADDGSQKPGPSAGTTEPAAAPANNAARKAIRKGRSNVLRRSTRRRGDPPAPSSAQHVIDRITRNRPASGHPASHSNVTRVAHTISGAKVRTRPQPARHKARGGARKTLPKIDPNHTRAATHTPGTIKVPAVAVKPAPPPRTAAARVLERRPSPTVTPRRETARAVVKRRLRR